MRVICLFILLITYLGSQFYSINFWLFVSTIYFSFKRYYIVMLDIKLKVFLYYILYFTLHYILIINYCTLTSNNYLLSVQTRYSLSPRKYILPFSCHLQHYRLKILSLFNKHKWVTNLINIFFYNIIYLILL